MFINTNLLIIYSKRFLYTVMNNREEGIKIIHSFF